MRTIGLLDGPPLRAASIVVEAASDSLSAHCVAFMVFDETAGEVSFNAGAMCCDGTCRFHLHSSFAATVRHEAEQVLARDLTTEAPNSGELLKLGMVSCLATAVFGPDEQPVGALVAFDVLPRNWTPIECERMRSFAYLITQTVWLRASLATLDIIASERKAALH